MSDDVSTEAAVQPEGQGGEAQSEAPYSEYLAQIPEQVRADVEPVFKKWDADTTRRFQEASEYRKGWEPYEQLGVRDIDPQEIEWFKGFRDLLADPQAVQTWFNNYATEVGLTPAEQAQLEDQPYVDPDVSTAVERLLEERLGPLSQGLEALTGWQQQQEQAARERAGLDAVESQFSALEEKHGQVNRDMIERFVGPYVDSDPEHAIARAYDDYTSFVAQIEKQTLAEKLGQPPAAEKGGVANSAAEPAKSLKDAAAQAINMMRANQSM